MDINFTREVIFMSLVTSDVNNMKITILEDYKDLLSAKDLSRLLGISTQTIYKEIKNGRFGEPLKFGREYRIPKVYIINKYFRRYLY